MNTVENKTGVRDWTLFDQDFMQEAYKSSLAGIITSLYPNSLTEPIILNGCVVTKTSIAYEITAGKIAYQGEVFEVLAKSIISTADAYFYLLDVKTSVPYLTGGSKPTYARRTFDLAITSTGTQVCLWNEIKRAEWVAFNQSHLSGDILLSNIISSDFDNTGLGKEFSRYEGFAICNGANGTIDMKGIFPVGQNPTSGSDYNIGDTGGVESVTLSLGQMPKHDHNVTVPAHVNKDWFDNGGETHPAYDNGSATATSTEEGNNEAHENRPPFRALCFIQKI